MEKLKTGIIGTGKVADIHASALVNIEESEFSAVCSRRIEKTQAFADKYGVHAFDNVEGMIAKTGIQAVVIGTPHPSFPFVTLDAQ